MLKKFLTISTILLGLGSYSSVVLANTCGGQIVPTTDCANSEKQYKIICCSGSKFTGVGYSDLYKQDTTDAITAICDGAVQGNNDFQQPPRLFQCQNDETAIGIAYADISGKDNLDGITVVCKNKSGGIRIVPNGDAGGNLQITAPQGKKVLGIAYKEMGGGSSDKVDCATIIHD